MERGESTEHCPFHDCGVPWPDLTKKAACSTKLQAQSPSFSTAPRTGVVGPSLQQPNNLANGSSMATKRWIPFASPEPITDHLCADMLDEAQSSSSERTSAAAAHEGGMAARCDRERAGSLSVSRAVLQALDDFRSWARSALMLQRSPLSVTVQEESSSAFYRASLPFSARHLGRILSGPTASIALTLELAGFRGQLQITGSTSTAAATEQQKFSICPAFASPISERRS